MNGLGITVSAQQCLLTVQYKERVPILACVLDPQRSQRFCRGDLLRQPAILQKVHFMRYDVRFPQDYTHFNIMNAFSTKYRNLYNSLSYLRYILRFFLSEMTAFIPAFSAFSTIASAMRSRMSTPCFKKKLLFFRMIGLTIKRLLLSGCYTRS